MRPFQANGGVASLPKSAARRQDDNIPVAGVPRQPLTTFVDDDEEDEEGVDDYANDHLTAPVPRGSGVGRIQPKQSSFKRIRLPDSVVALKPKERPATTPPVSTFVDPFYSGRPVQEDPNEPVLVNLQRLPNLPPPTTPSPRQTFRRVKPQQSSNGNVQHRRVKPKNHVTSPPRIQPSRTLNEPRSQLPITSSVSNELNRLTARGPINNGQRYRDDELFNKHNALDNVGDIIEANGLNRNQFNPPQPPLEAFDDNGVLTIERVTSSFQPPQPPTLRSSKVHQPRPSSSVLTPTIPLTFYTTFTYLTTVFRGQHTALLSREQISSTVQVRPIDRSIVTAIEFNDGYIQPTRAVAAIPLGTKTKGATTTVYNLASRVQVYNDDLYKVIYSSKDVASKALTSSLESSAYIEPTRTLRRPHPVSSTQYPNAPLRVADLEKEDKKYVSKYTYFFTIFDKLNTRYSTRVEESTVSFVGSIGSQPLESSIDGQGLLKIVSTKTATLPLASRVHNKLTTVVNLALNNYIKFDNLKDAKIDIKPTRLIVSPTPTLLSSKFHGPSSSLELASSSVSVSPVEPASSSIQSEINSIKTRTLESSLVLVSASKLPNHQQQQPSITSSIFVGQRPPSRRPGVRVKVKPIRSKVSSRLSSIAATTTTASFELELSSSLLASPIRHPSSSSALSSSTPPPPSLSTASVNHGSSTNVALSISSSLSLSSSSSTSNRNELISPTAVVSATSSSELTAVPTIAPAATPTLNRKKVAFTVRRPGVPGGNRFFSRRPSTLPSRGVINTQSYSTSSVELASSSIVHIEDGSSNIQPTPAIESSVLLLSSTEALSSSSSITPSKSTKRKLIFTRISGNNNNNNAHNNWNPIHSSRIRVSSRKIWKSSSVVIEPQSQQPVETILETTTHTVPFTYGAKTIYTTVEETNRRVVTKMNPMVTPSLVEASFVSTTVSSVGEQPSSSIATESLKSSMLPNEKMTTIVETSDKLTISTLYSTLTYFATLFNGTQTRITPLEEIKTEYLTLREPVIVTRTIKPTQAFTTLSTSSDASISSLAHNQQLTTQTYSTHTTLTHFITLFSGTRTILSSIEEISPTVVTKTVPVSVTSQTMAVWSSNDASMATSSSSMPSYVVEDVASSDNVQPSQTSSTSADVVESIIELSPTLASSSEMTTTTTTAVIQPGSVIELNDILHGEISNVGQIGETIKDIVHKVVNAQDEAEVTTTTTEKTEVTTSMLQPSFETTVGSVTTSSDSSSTTTTSTSPLSSFTAKNRHFTVPKYQHSHVHPTGISVEEDKAIFSTESETNTEVTRYVTSIEKSTRTIILTSTKVSVFAFSLLITSSSTFNILWLRNESNRSTTPVTRHLQSHLC